MLSLSILFSFFLIFLSSFFIHYSDGRIFTFEVHHRYSEHVKNWSHGVAKSTNSIVSHHWPDRGSFEYYADLAARDRILRGRKISEIEEPVTFSEGNASFRISSLGFLHYTTVKLGTPGTKFLVALDTGSDLFWVPCDCARCAPISGTNYGSNFELSIYNPKVSSTSKKISCNDSLCEHRSKCLGAFSHCPYVISYVSAETSTSGILVEDVIHLSTEDNHRELVEAFITFGCGQVQTGSFLDAAAPNGLFGLGMENISVPSILAREGFIANSFSMCFGRDGIGRISFGDKGVPDQEETSFNVNSLHPTYNVTVTQIQVGTVPGDIEFTALFDSGTSFTYLVDPAYSMLSGSFDSQIKDERRPADSRIPFEYCYNMGPESNTGSLPSMSLAMKGGSHFTVFDPVIVISTENELLYCLAVVKSTELNIIGQNFMTGYRIIFDREKYILGWKNSNCYDIQVGDIPESSNVSVVSPAIAAEPGNKTEDAKRSLSRSSASPKHKSFVRYLCVIFSIILNL